MSASTDFYALRYLPVSFPRPAFRIETARSRSRLCASDRSRGCLSRGKEWKQHEHRPLARHARHSLNGCQRVFGFSKLWWTENPSVSTISLSMWNRGAGRLFLSRHPNPCSNSSELQFSPTSRERAEVGITPFSRQTWKGTAMGGIRECWRVGVPLHLIRHDYQHLPWTGNRPRQGRQVSHSPAG